MCFWLYFVWASHGAWGRIDTPAVYLGGPGESAAACNSILKHISVLVNVNKFWGPDLFDLSNVLFIFSRWLLMLLEGISSKEGRVKTVKLMCLAGVRAT